jgi:outer membrane murein-binding lipoprotein Lpp
MAVIQAARLRSARGASPPVYHRARIATATGGRSAPRLRPAGILMAAILASTMLGLVYLTQTLGSNATSSQIRDLAAQREELGRQLRNQALAVETYADPVEVGRKALKRGLVELDDVLVLKVP